MSQYAKYPVTGGGGGGSGTVTSVSVVSAHGFAGTVANPTTTPAITISTTITGILQGDGTSISAATTGNLTDAGTDGIVITSGTGAVLGSGTAIAQHVADASHNGYLSSTDWSTFNSKQAALTLGNLTDAGTDGITVTGGTGAIVGSGTSLSQHVADTSHNGYLSSTDWNTFSGKQSTVTIGALDAQAENANGLALVSNVLSSQSADATHPGMVNITTQTFAGQKTFSTGLTGTLTGHASLDLALTGGTMSGAISMGSHLINSVTDPVSAQDAATKNYVDSAVAALNPATACYAASTTNIAGTYANGTAGVGATFTTTATGTFTIDGVTPALGARILIKDQSSGLQNGIYTITTLGITSVQTVFTRALDYNTAADMNTAGLIPIQNGTVNALSSWQQIAVITTVGTDALMFSEFTANPSLYLLKANNLSDVAAKSTSFDNLSPMTTLGDIILGGASGAGARLAIGTRYQVLQATATTAAYDALHLDQAAAVTGTLPVGNGGTGVTSVTTAPAATAFAGWDTNKNLSANAIIKGYTTRVSSGSPVSLTVSSAQTQVVTGSSVQVFLLPDTSTLALGRTFRFINNTNTNLIIQNTAGVQIEVVSATNSIVVICINIASNTSAWYWNEWFQGSSVPIGMGGTGQTVVPTSILAGNYSAWDSNGNFSANNFINGYATTATGATTTTLTVASLGQQYFTGSTTQTVKLPVTSTLVLGQQFTVINNSTGIVTVQSSGSNTITAMVGSSTAVFTCILTSGTTAASWSAAYVPAFASASTASTAVVRDGSGNFSAGTITAALTGTASGNTTYTPNNHGMIVSGSGNVMTVIAPDASTTKVWTCGGVSADPSWQPATGGGITSEYAGGNTGASFTANFTTNGASQTFTMNSASVAMTLAGGVGGNTYTMRFVQDGTGGRVLTYTTSIKWPGGIAPTLSTAASAIDIYTLYFDGTSWYGTFALGMS